MRMEKLTIMKLGRNIMITNAEDFDIDLLQCLFLLMNIVNGLIVK